MLSVVIVVSLWSVCHAIHDHREAEFQRIQNYEIVYFDTDSLDTQNILKLTAFGQNYHIELQANEDMIASNIVHNNMDPADHTDDQFITSATTSCHYFGKTSMEEQDNLTVLGHHSPLSLCARKGIRGRIQVQDDVLIVYPAAYFLDHEKDSKCDHKLSDAHLIYKLSEFDSSDYGLNDAPHEHQLIEQVRDNAGQQALTDPNRRRLAYNSGRNYLEMLIVSGPVRTIWYKKTYGLSMWLEMLTSDYMDTVNTVNSEYAAGAWTVGFIRIVLVQLDIIDGNHNNGAVYFTGDYATLKPDFLEPETCSTYGDCQINGRGWLSIFKAWLAAKRDLSTFDNAQLVSNMQFRTNYAGWGNVGTVCRGGGSSSNMYVGWGLNFLAHTMAHELGHNFGMKHDKMSNDCGNKDGIMGYGMTKGWSTCSISEMAAYFAGNGAGCSCLANTPKTLQRFVGPRPTPKPTRQPTPRPIAATPSCSYSTSIEIKGMKSAESVSFNGYWSFLQCFNGHAAYKFDKALSSTGGRAKYLCYHKQSVTAYGTIGYYIITNTLCSIGTESTSNTQWPLPASARMASYSTNLINSCSASNPCQWDVLRGHGWARDPKVYIYERSASGAYIDAENELDCMLSEEYTERLCIHSTNTSLWTGDRTFSVSHGLCQNDRPIYQHRTGEDTFYLHFVDDQLSFSDGNDTISQWIISKNRISVNYLAYCISDSLTNCTKNAWMVSSTQTNQRFSDGLIEDIWDEFMSINFSMCPSDIIADSADSSEEDNERLTILDLIVRNTIFLVSATSVLAVICIVFAFIVFRRISASSSSENKSICEGFHARNGGVTTSTDLQVNSVEATGSPTSRCSMDSPRSPTARECSPPGFPDLPTSTSDHLEMSPARQTNVLRLEVSVDKSSEHPDEIEVVYQSN